MSDSVDAAAIQGALRGRLGLPLRTYDSIGSTSTEAALWAAKGAPHGALVVADHQTAGRGRGARRWTSLPGRAVQASLVLRPSAPPARARLVTTAVGVAVAEALEDVAPLRARLKWPNDVIVRGGKIAGILVESRVTGASVEAVIAGIGINVAGDCEEVARAVGEGATSIACELEGAGRSAPPPTRAGVLAAVLWRVEEALALVGDEAGSAELVRRAAARSAVLGRDVRVQLPDGSSLEGRAEALLPSGELVMIVDGQRRAVDAGEIEHLRPA